ncbi:MAG: transposase family protein [Polaromonas sp.]|jgi:hypothetical protein|nr:transposase family protein [Polaromonas sp.]
MQLFIDEVASRYPNESIVMVVDGAGWHKAGSLQLPGNLRLHFLPPYSLELNLQEHIWDELHEKHLSTTVFLTASMHWKTNSSKPSKYWRKTPSACTALPVGTGSLIHFLMSFPTPRVGEAFMEKAGMGIAPRASPTLKSERQRRDDRLGIGARCKRAR